MSKLTDEQRLDWLRLIRSENVGPRTFRVAGQSFRRRARGARRAARAGAARRRAARRSASVRAHEAEREIEAAQRRGVALRRARRSRTIRRGSPMIDDAPPLLAVRGKLAALARPMVAIVGSRNASAAGLKFAERLARELGEAGFVDRVRARARHRRGGASREPCEPAPSRCSPAGMTASIRPSTPACSTRLLAERRRDLRNAARLGAARARLSRAATG